MNITGLKADEVLYRVVCKDGVVTDYTTHLDDARFTRDNANQGHDDSCGPHRIERAAGWVRVIA